MNTPSKFSDAAERNQSGIHGSRVPSALGLYDSGAQLPDESRQPHGSGSLPGLLPGLLLEDPLVQTDLNLVQLLSQRALVSPHQTAFEFLSDSAQPPASLTYSQLDQGSRALAMKLLEIASPGDRVLIFQSPGFDYLISFWGCLYAGLVAVPVFPPRFNQRLDRIQAIVEDTKAKVALTRSQSRTSLGESLQQYPALNELYWLATDELTSVSDPSSGAPRPNGQSVSAADWHEPKLTGDSIAFLQFTSGSTSQPKGVMLSHQNLLSNLRAIYEKFGHSHQSRGVIWLPPYHDMGLIGGILQPIFGGFPCTLMSPYGFLQRPLRWLQTVSQTQATTSGGPNFAYELCTRRISQEQVKALDLSHWKVAFCGAEPIQSDVLERFARHFAPAGFDPTSFYPCYGLAEASLMVSGGLVRNPLVVRRFDAAALENHQVKPLAPQPQNAPNSIGNAEGVASPNTTVQLQPTQGARACVGCGSAPKGHEIAIVDPLTFNRSAPGVVGEVWFRGPSVAQGYWGRPEETQATFGAILQEESKAAPGPHQADSLPPPLASKRWLRTGDLGFMEDDELFITGRIKDLIILRGRNIYPMDIESTVSASHPALKVGGTAAFSVDHQGQEALVVVQELDRSQAKTANPEELFSLIQKRVFAEHDLRPLALVLIRDHTLPTTSSGKVRRQDTKRAFLNSTLTEVARYVDDAY